MEPRGVGTGWLCVAVLCAGAALDLKGEEPGHPSTTQRDDVLEPTGDPTTSIVDVEELTTWPTATPTPLWSGDPPTTPVPIQAGAAGNKTQNTSAVPVRYWAPVIFVVVALVVLFFTYRRTRGEGTQDQAASASSSSDLGALDHVPSRDTTPIIPAPQEQRKELEKPPPPEHTETTETTFCEPDPPPASAAAAPARHPHSHRWSPLLRGARCRLRAPEGSPGASRPPPESTRPPEAQRGDRARTMCPAGAHAAGGAHLDPSYGCSSACPNPGGKRGPAWDVATRVPWVRTGARGGYGGHSRANKAGFHPRTPGLSLLGGQPPMPSPAITFSPRRGTEQRRRAAGPRRRSFLCCSVTHGGEKKTTQD
ncbi:uncharacterized protein LOC142365032 [Opisthocomus hoazin]|uniref:uncharacterized protein LOC142365032 n=1 Tax=Opisthocomus hoazin TaxID=30419 RepID=UPI003F539237